MITIESQNGWFKAILEDVEDGIAIAIWQRMSGSGWKPFHRETLDCPFHVACDLTLADMNRLRRDVFAWPTKSRVRVTGGQWL